MVVKKNLMPCNFFLAYAVKRRKTTCMADEQPVTNEETTESTTLGIRIPDDLRAKIREAARIEQRTESSFARFYLSKAADSVLSDTNAQPA